MLRGVRDSWRKTRTVPWGIKRLRVIGQEALLRLRIIRMGLQVVILATGYLDTGHYNTCTMIAALLLWVVL